MIRLALTPGEPAGIGPDLCIQIAQQRFPAEIVAVADPALMMQRARELALPLKTVIFDPAIPPQAHTPGTLMVLPVPLAKSVQCGKLDTANAEYVLNTLPDLCFANRSCVCQCT